MTGTPDLDTLPSIGCPCGRRIYLGAPVTDTPDAPVLRDPDDEAAAQVAALTEAVETPDNRTWFSIENVGGGPCCGAHARNPDADPERHFWWPDEDTQAAAEPQTVPDTWKAVGFTTDGAGIFTAPAGTPPPKVGESIRRVADRALAADAEQVAARVERGTPRIHTIAEHLVADRTLLIDQVRLRDQIQASQIADAMRPDDVCPACWLRAMSLPGNHGAHAADCEWYPQRLVDVEQLAATMVKAADDAVPGEWEPVPMPHVRAMATQALDNGWAPASRAHLAGARAQGEYLLTLLEEEAAGLSHSGGSLPHSYASDCVRCGIERAARVIREAAGDDE